MVLVCVLNDRNATPCSGIQLLSLVSDQWKNPFVCLHFKNSMTLVQSFLELETSEKNVRIMCLDSARWRERERKNNSLVLKAKCRLLQRCGKKCLAQLKSFSHHWRERKRKSHLTCISAVLLMENGGKSDLGTILQFNYYCWRWAKISKPVQRPTGLNKREIKWRTGVFYVLIALLLRATQKMLPWWCAY